MKKLKKFICIFAIGFSTTTFLLSYEETKKLIDDFIYYYNNARIKQNLGWKTPSEMSA